MRQGPNMRCLSLRACHTRSHLCNTTCILKITVKITNLINESTGCFVLYYMSDAFERFFFCGSVIWKRLHDKWDNSIFCSVLPLVYFIYEIECRRWSIFNRVISKRFIAIAVTKPGRYSSWTKAGPLWRGTGRRWKETQSPQFFLLAF